MKFIHLTFVTAALAPLALARPNPMPRAAPEDSSSPAEEATTQVAAAALDPTCVKTYTDLSGASAVTYYNDQVWYEGRLAWCFPFHDRTLAHAGPAERNRLRANPIVFVEYPTGESAGDPIVSSIPCQTSSYSDAWIRFTAVVDPQTPYNSFRDYAQIDKSEYELKRVGFYNFPMVPPGSQLVDRSNITVNAPETFSAWFGGQKVYLFDFGPVAQDNTLDYVQVSEALATFQKDEFEVPVRNGFPIVNAIPTQAKYTGFYNYQSLTTEDQPFNSLRSYQNATAETVPTERKLFLNCPIGHVDSFEYDGNPPVLSSPLAPVPAETIPEPPAPVERNFHGCEYKYLNGTGAKYFSAVGWSNGKKYGCWNFGVRTELSPFALDSVGASLVRAFQPVYSNGDSAGLPIFTTLPCLRGYSDAVELISFVVPSEVPFNFFKEADAFLYASDLKVSGRRRVNFPIVEPGSTIEINPSDEAPTAAYLNTPRLSEGWYKGETVYYVNFGPIANRFPNDPWLHVSGSVFPYRKNLLGDSVLFGNPVFETVDGDPFYTGFYSVGKIPAVAADQFKEFGDVDQSSVSAVKAVLNCPTAYFT
ncbi:hypothetical protein HDU96_006496 [Phlyctochytrium bullatum]|nr:hypothetical protein HDU96_006496 [Phlyctochytrium bullatum]